MRRSTSQVFVSFLELREAYCKDMRNKCSIFGLVIVMCVKFMRNSTREHLLGGIHREPWPSNFGCYCIGQRKMGSINKRPFSPTVHLRSDHKTQSKNRTTRETDLRYFPHLVILSAIRTFFRVSVTSMFAHHWFCFFVCLFPPTVAA